MKPAKSSPDTLTRFIKQPEVDPPISISSAYRVKKYGLWRYQLIKIDPVSGVEHPVGQSNVYGVIASELSDRLIRELSGDKDGV